MRETVKLDTQIQITHFLRRHTKTALYHVAEIEFLLLRGERPVLPSSTGGKGFSSFPKRLHRLRGPLILQAHRSPNRGLQTIVRDTAKKSWGSLNRNLEIQREFLSSGWQYWTNLYAVATVSLFCSGQFVLRAIFNYMMAKFSYIGVSRDTKRYFKDCTKEKNVG